MTPEKRDELRELIAEVKACEAIGWPWPRTSEALSAFHLASHEALPALLDEVERLRKALEPFAERYDERVRTMGKEGSPETLVQVRLGHLEFARSALNPKGEWNMSRTPIAKETIEAMLAHARAAQPDLTATLHDRVESVASMRKTLTENEYVIDSLQTIINKWPKP